MADIHGEPHDAPGSAPGDASGPGAAPRRLRPLPPWDEMRAPDGAVRPHWQVLDGALKAFGPGEMWRRWEQARQLIRQHGVTFNVYGDPRGLERPWPLDPVPVLLSADEFAVAGGGARAAGAAARPAAGRSLRPAADDRRGGGPARGLPGAPEPPARLRRAGAAGRALPALLRRRSGAHARRDAARDGRSHAGARPGRATRSRTGSCSGACCRRRFATRTRSGWRCSSARCARRWPALAPQGVLEPAHRAADRRAAQRDLLRAGLPGAVPRLSAGRGGRSDGARRARLSEDAGRAAPGRRDPAAAARRLLRSAGAARRLAAGRAGAPAGGARRDGRRRQRHRHRRAADAGADPVSARALPRAAGRGAEAAVGRDLVVRRAGDPRARAREPARDGGQADLSAGPDRSDLRRAARSRGDRDAGGHHPRDARAASWRSGTWPPRRCR